MRQRKRRMYFTLLSRSLRGCFSLPKRVHILAFALLVSTSTYAQMPVIDTTQIQHHLQAIGKLKEQIKQLEQQYKAISGTRKLGAIFNNAAFYDYLPPEWATIYRDLQEKGYKGLEGEALRIHESSQVFDSCHFLPAGDQRLACEAQASKAAQDQAFAMQAYEIAQKRVIQIEQLMEAINSTTDLKAITELQGRIAVEQANIQNEKIKLAMYELVSTAQERLQVQRMHEIHMRDAAKRGGLNVQPKTFTWGAN